MPGIVGVASKHSGKKHRKKGQYQVSSVKCQPLAEDSIHEVVDKGQLGAFSTACLRPETIHCGTLCGK